MDKAEVLRVARECGALTPAVGGVFFDPEQLVEFANSVEALALERAAQQYDQKARAEGNEYTAMRYENYAWAIRALNPKQQEK